MRFVIDALVNEVLAPDFTFVKAITMTLEYDEALLGNLIENTLEVHYWDIYTQEWRTDGVRVIEHDVINNRIVIEIEHLTEFGIFGQPQTQASPDQGSQLYLPVMR